MRAQAPRDFNENAGLAALWIGILAAPLATLAQLQINYALVLWACRTSQVWPLHTTAAIALLISLAGGFLSWRNWKRAGGSLDNHSEGILPRSGFMATVGILGSGLFALVVIAQWIPIGMYGPCER